MGEKFPRKFNIWAIVCNDVFGTARASTLSLVREHNLDFTFFSVNFMSLCQIKKIII
jgi:hypothetical protein